MDQRVHDLAVVGAGIAGLAAARRATAHGLDAIVLEATDRIGGRIQTVTRDDGCHWDAGAHWLRQPAINPLLSEADRLQVHYLKQWRGQDGFWLDGVWLDERAIDDLWLEIDEVDDLARDLPSVAEDAALIELLNPASDFAGMVDALLTYQHGIGLDRVSVIDRSQYGSFEGDWPVRSGFGSFISRLFGDDALDIRLNTPVAVIDWGSDPIRLDLAGDLVSAQRVVVTASTGVLQSGQIHFAPDLPESTRAAIADLPMATQSKVAFVIGAGALELEPDSLHVTRRDDRTVIFHALPDAQPLMIGIVSGDISRDLEEGGEGELTNLVIERFSDVFGSGVAGTITDPQSTIWLANPFVLGAWAVPVPGAALARVDLRAPVDGRLFFAGEATSMHAGGTAHGAYQSGIDAADRIAESLGLEVESAFGVDNLTS